MPGGGSDGRSRTKVGIVFRAEERSFEMCSGVGPLSSGPIYPVIDRTKGVGLEEHCERGRPVPQGVPC